MIPPNENESLDILNTSLFTIERSARYRWLGLLVEWGQKDAIDKLLKGVEDDHYFNKASLNNALQTALEKDRCAFLNHTCIKTSAWTLLVVKLHFMFQNYFTEYTIYVSAQVGNRSELAQRRS